MDHDLSPPWTLINIMKAIKSVLFTELPQQCTIGKNIAFQMVNNGLIFQEQSWIPDTHKAPNWSLSPLHEQTTMK